MIKVDNISFMADDLSILDGITFVLNKKDRLGLVGPNGAGKSTLLKIIAGLIKPTAGVVFNPNHLGIAYFPQEIIGTNKNSTVSKFISSFQSAVSHINIDILAKLDITNNDLTKKISNLSGGQKTRVCLAGIMLSDADVILLDEPTNNLDLDGIEQLEQFIERSPKIFVIVSHDRRFLNSIASKIVAIEKNKFGADVYGTSFDEYLLKRKQEKELEEQRYSTSVKDKKRLESTFVEKREAALKAEKSRNIKDNDKTVFNKRKNRAAKNMMKSAKALKSRIEKLAEIEDVPKEFDLNYIFSENTSHLGHVVAQLDEVVTKYEASKESIGPFNLQINRNERIVIMGSNGSGKTSLIKLLTGDLKAVSGQATIGPSVVFGLIDQEQTFPEPRASVFVNFKALIGSRTNDTKEEGKLRGFLHSMGVRNLENKPEEISPGERSRVLVTALALRGCNVLLFDEPTNHLDLRAIDELEKALLNYNGTYVVVSHDRSFIENIKPNRTIEMSNKGIIRA